MDIKYKKSGRTGDVMKLRAIQDLRALRLCNPPALQLRRQSALYGPPLARGVFSVFDFYLKSIPILTDTTCNSFLVQRYEVFM